MANKMDLDPIFNAKTMAVIGVSSQNDSHPANVIYNKNPFVYPLKDCPVNPKGGTIKVEILYHDITKTPDRIDPAVIAARADFVPDIVEKCIRHEAGDAVIISGGFAESGKGDIRKGSNFSSMVADFEDHIQSIELNPVICPGERSVIADARIILNGTNFA